MSVNGGRKAAPGGGLRGCRNQFPALEIKVGGRPVVFFDGPGGTQMPSGVFEAMGTYLFRQNANAHGSFFTSRETDRIVDQARSTICAFLGASSPCEIAFGQNMTTLNFRLARMIARDLRPGDEVLITELDHEANRAPWLALRDRGVVVREVRVDTASCRLEMTDFQAKLCEKTRVVAVGAASNAVGTVTALEQIRRMTSDAGALLVVDAVHYVPHLPADVAAMGCDFLLCSAYKFFGPHLGVLYGRRGAFERLRCYKVEPQLDSIPHRMETGTPNFEGIAGAAAAVRFLAGLGAGGGADAGGVQPGSPDVSALRRAVLAGMAAVQRYEGELADRLLSELADMPGVVLYGPPKGAPRTPTAAFSVQGRNAREIASRLGEQGIFVWDGDFYATTLVRRLGLADSGGLVRIGFAPYNTSDEVDRAVKVLRSFVTDP